MYRVSSILQRNDFKHKYSLKTRLKLKYIKYWYASVPTSRDLRNDSLNAKTG